MHKYGVPSTFQFISLVVLNPFSSSILKSYKLFSWDAKKPYFY